MSDYTYGFAKNTVMLQIWSCSARFVLWTQAVSNALAHVTRNATHFCMPVQPSFGKLTPVLALELSAAAKLSPSSSLHHAQCLTTMMRTLRGAKTFDNTFCAIDDDFHQCGVAKPAVSMYMRVYTHISKMMITCNWIQ